MPPEGVYSVVFVPYPWSPYGGHAVQYGSTLSNILPSQQIKLLMLLLLLFPWSILVYSEEVMSIVKLFVEAWPSVWYSVTLSQCIPQCWCVKILPYWRGIHGAWVHHGF